LTINTKKNNSIENINYLKCEKRKLKKQIKHHLSLDVMSGFFGSGAVLKT